MGDFLFSMGIKLGVYRQSHFLITGSTGDVHGLEITSLYHGNGQSARSRQVTEREHQVPEIHIILEKRVKHT